MARRRDDDDELDRDDEEAIDEIEDVESEEPEEPEAPRPKAKNTVLTILLALFNLLAAGTFGYLLFMDYQVRREWENRCVWNVLQGSGLPLAAEEDPSLASESRPVMKLSGEQIKQVFDSRKETKKTSEPFLAVNEPLPIRITPTMMKSDWLRKEHFEGDTPVATLEEEVDRQKSATENRIRDVAKEFVTKYKDDNAKKAVIREILLPMAWSVENIRNLDDVLTGKIKINLTTDALLEETIQRRILADILVPLNLFRPAALENFSVEKVAAVTVDAQTRSAKFAANVDDLYAQLGKRFEQSKAATFNADVHYGKLWLDAIGGEGTDANKLHSVEKRQQISFLLFTVSQARIPKTAGPDNYVVPNAMRRAEKVVGLNEFSMAALNYADMLRDLRNVVETAIQEDRDGAIAKNKAGEVLTTGGYVWRYLNLVENAKKIDFDVDFARKRYAELAAQSAQLDVEVKDRAAHYTSLQNDLVARKEATKKVLEQLQKRQQEIFQAQIVLSGASEENARLESMIRDLEIAAARGARP